MVVLQWINVCLYWFHLVLRVQMVAGTGHRWVPESQSSSIKAYFVPGIVYFCLCTQSLHDHVLKFVNFAGADLL